MHNDTLHHNYVLDQISMSEGRQAPSLDSDVEPETNTLENLSSTPYMSCMLMGIIIFCVLYAVAGTT